MFERYYRKHWKGWSGTPLQFARNLVRPLGWMFVGLLLTPADRRKETELLHELSTSNSQLASKLRNEVRHLLLVQPAALLTIAIALLSVI